MYICQKGKKVPVDQKGTTTSRSLSTCVEIKLNPELDNGLEIDQKCKKNSKGCGSKSAEKS